MRILEAMLANTEILMVGTRLIYLKIFHQKSCYDIQNVENHQNVENLEIVENVEDIEVTTPCADNSFLPQLLLLIAHSFHNSLC